MPPKIKVPVATAVSRLKGAISATATNARMSKASSLPIPAPHAASASPSSLPCLDSPSQWVPLSLGSSSNASRPHTHVGGMISARTISLSRSLQGGQCFTWRCVPSDHEVVVRGGGQRGEDSSATNKRVGTAAVAPLTAEAYSLSSAHPSFIGAFKGTVVQLGVADGADEAIIVRCFTSTVGGAKGSTATAANVKTLGNKAGGSRQRVADGHHAAVVDDALKASLIHYLGVAEDLGSRLSQWRASGHPITELLPLPPSSPTPPRAGGRARGSAKGGSVAKSSPSPSLPSSLRTSSTLTESPVRLLRQDFIECFFSFLCSQNNNVKRIASLVLKLGETYGCPLGYVALVPKEDGAKRGANNDDGEERGDSPAHGVRNKARRVETKKASVSASSNGSNSNSSNTLLTSTVLSFYAFPSLEQLKAQCTDEAVLRDLGFGYRARYVVECAKSITPAMVAGLNAMGRGEGSGEYATAVPKNRKGSPSSLSPSSSSSVSASLADREQWALRTAQVTQQKRQILMGLCGVGRKVADCVLLFSLGERTLVPIDTHMAQIALKYFEAELSVAANKKRGKAAGGEGQSPPKGAAAQTKKKAVGEKRARPAASEGSDEAAAPTSINLTPAVHDRMQTLFLEAFGAEAGWAHSFLFAERIGVQNTQ